MDGGRKDFVPESASRWLVHECWVDPEWKRRPALLPVLVARRSEGGRIALASFVIDLACLGAKNGFSTVLGAARYEAVRAEMFPRGRERCDLALAAKIVRSGIGYARSLGFSPHPDAVAALPLLGPELPCDVDVPVGGPSGIPMLVPGPFDDARRLVEQLASRLGPDGFDLGLGPDGYQEWLDEVAEDDPESDEPPDGYLDLPSDAVRVRREDAPL